ncbi:MAG: hypothetical protein FKY71_16170 [Spiribacter salinus]|uniref:Uncharacterized protein n=1 Tax=Spiribacter salinus TaxID=1335746 RepID=A0A540VMD9_9GAMM|nr:MAG: hypothetical protein FKY71_16170 [Spiribacter salinus]
MVRIPFVLLALSVATAAGAIAWFAHAQKEAYQVVAVAGDIGDASLLADGLGRAHGILMWGMGTSAALALCSAITFITSRTRGRADD